MQDGSGKVIEVNISADKGINSRLQNGWNIHTNIHLITCKTKVLLLSSLTENIDAFLQSTEDESEQIRNIVYIMDRFSISLAGYHELAQINKSLPRMHLISKCTKDLDEKIEAAVNHLETKVRKLGITCQKLKEQA